MRRLTCTCGKCPTCWNRARYRREKARKTGRTMRNPYRYGGSALHASESRFEAWAAKQRAVWDEESKRLREWIDRVKREAATSQPGQNG
jgi:hypothetical protein